VDGEGSSVGVASSGAVLPDEGITRTVSERVLTSRSRIRTPSSFGETGENGAGTDVAGGATVVTGAEDASDGVCEDLLSLMRCSQGPSQYAPAK
jgi:hypothetical protein